MPFTLSHPAAILPLARGPLAPSALAAGSMAPDLPYFVGFGDLRGLTHEPVGVVTVDLALGLGLLGVFHLLWKRPLLALAPGPVARRLAVAGGPLPRRLLLWAPVAVLAGVVTHVFWDAFTHRYHSFADVLPWLVTTSVGGLELYKWLQYGSGVLGLAVLAWWLHRWFRTAPVTAEAPRGLSARASAAVGGLLVSGAVLGGVLGAAFQIKDPGAPRDPRVTVVGGVVGTMSGFLLVFTFYALAWLVAGRAVTSSRSGSGPGSGP